MGGAADTVHKRAVVARGSEEAVMGARLISGNYAGMAWEGVDSTLLSTRYQAMPA